MASTRRKSQSWPEIAPREALPAWYQLHTKEDWEPGRGEVDAFHQDCQGLRLVTDRALPRNRSLVVSVKLDDLDSLHARGVVVESAKHGDRHAAVVRFEHLSEVDRRMLNTHLVALARKLEQPPSVPDQRRHRRYLKSIEVDYQVLDRRGRRRPGQGSMVTLDISGSGMKIRLEQKMSVGDLLYLRLPLDPDAFFSLARVAWTEKSKASGQYVAGLEFMQLPAIEQARLMASLDGTTVYPVC